jgi:hypothetical protein
LDSTLRPLHDRQFAIGPRPIALPGWEHHQLAPGLTLSRSPSLPFDGTTLGVMLGDDLDTAAGRFIRIVDGEIELDAAGTLGVLYRRVGGELWVSSSPELLRTLEPELAPPAADAIQWGRRECFEPPRTGIDGVYRLMSTQTLDLATGDIRRRPILIGDPPASYSAAVDELEQLLRAAVRAAGERFGGVHMLLTGGSDSRRSSGCSSAAHEIAGPLRRRLDRVDDRVAASEIGDRRDAHAINFPQPRWRRWIFARRFESRTCV